MHLSSFPEFPKIVAVFSLLPPNDLIMYLYQLNVDVHCLDDILRHVDAIRNALGDAHARKMVEHVQSFVIAEMDAYINMGTFLCPHCM